MSLNYSYVMMIDIKNKQKFIDFINSHGEFNEHGTAINCEIDSFILNYLEEWYEDIKDLEEDEVEEIKSALVKDNKARIGGMDYDEESKEANSKIMIRLTAVCRSISYLFDESAEVKRWFIELSREVDSYITYLDLESEGTRIIYFKGEEVNIEFKGSGHLRLKSEKLIEVINEFADSLKYY